MIKLTTLPNASSSASETCEGGCKGCNTAHIKLMGYHDAASKQLRSNVEKALAGFPVTHKIIEVSEPNLIAAAGVTGLPALLLDNQVMTQEYIPTPLEITEMLRNRFLYRSKLYRLNKIGVGADFSEVSGSALRFAWHIARMAGSSIEVTNVSDSLFDGDQPSDSGFLTAYQQTIRQELDAFVRDNLANEGVQSAVPEPGAPGQMPPQPPALPGSKVIYGFPEQMLEECSIPLDLLVLGTTGRGAWQKKMFGSVSIEISKRTHCPVLLVPPDAEFRGLQNILYASDMDSLSALSIRQVVSFAKHFDGQLHFVHVGADDATASVRKKFESGYRESHAPQPFLFTNMMGSDVIGTLFEYALYHRVELLVFVTHRRRFWENLLHKSVSREAILGTDLPILILHSDDDLLHH